MSAGELLEVTRIADGFWRWAAPHPEWTPEKDRPGGWPRMVGSVYCEPPAGADSALALVDPLAPPAGSAEAGRFWAALDRDVERVGLPVIILVGNGYHVRGAVEFQRRYSGMHGAEIHAHTDAIPRIGFEPTRCFDAQTARRTGIETFPVEGLDDGETALFIRHHRALVFADAVIGTGGGRLAVVPQSWAGAGAEAADRYRQLFRLSLRQLLDLDPAIVLPSHGAPALSGGGAALAAALDAPAWGE